MGHLAALFMVVMIFEDVLKNRVETTIGKEDKKYQFHGSPDAFGG